MTNKNVNMSEYMDRKYEIGEYEDFQEYMLNCGYVNWDPSYGYSTLDDDSLLHERNRRFTEALETDDEAKIAEKMEEVEKIGKHLIAKLEGGLLGKNLNEDGDWVWDSGIKAFCKNYRDYLKNDKADPEKLKKLEDEVKALKIDKLYFDPYFKISSYTEMVEDIGTSFEKPMKEILSSKSLFERALARDVLVAEDVKKVKKVLKEMKKMAVKDRAVRLEKAKAALKLAKKPDAIYRAELKVARIEAEIA